MRQIILLILPLLLLSGCVTGNMNLGKGGTSEIAIAMPLSGEYGKMGRNVAHMIELGLQEGLRADMNVTIYDITSDYKLDYAASRIKSSGVKLVLGPIFSPHTTNLASKLSDSGVKVISLSNNPAIAGKNIYVFGHSPIRQTRRIINHMLNERYENFIVLLPVGRYYNDLSSHIASLVDQGGGKLISTEFYIGREESIHAAVDNIAKIAKSINESEENIKKPVLYISDDSMKLKHIMHAIKRNNLDLTTIIAGDNKIDAGFDAEVPYIFTGSLKYDHDMLLEKIQKYSPDKTHLDHMDLMAYDLGRIVSHNLSQNYTIDQMISRLDDGHLYLGASGDIKFVDQIAYRKYDIIRRSESGYEIMDRSK